jgi:hypothetical protein
MHGIHRTLMQRVGAPLLQMANGESDGGGDTKLQYRQKKGGTVHELTGIKLPRRNNLQPDFAGGGVKRRDTTSWQITRVQLDAIGVTFPQQNAIVTDPDGDWLVDVDQCVWGPTFVTLALAREPRTQGNELRGAAV